MVLLKFKPGTQVDLLDSAIIPGLVAFITLMESALDVNKLIVTSVNDGVHKSGSLHYQGRAIDFRSKIYPRERLEHVVAEFRKLYSADYQLLWEHPGQPNEHLHLEYDVGNKNR